MAKGDVTLKFDAEDAQFVQKVLKARQELQAAANDARKFAGETAKGGDQMLKTITSVAGAMGIFTTASEVVSAGVHVVMGTLENYMQRIEDRADGLLHRVQTLNQAAGGAGQIGAAPGIRKQLRELSDQKFGGMQLSEQELTKAAAGIFTDLGARATPNNVVAGAEAYGHARAGGMGDDAAQKVASNYARLAGYRDRKEGFQGFSDEKLRDFAYSSSVYKPDMSDKDWRFVARAKDKEQALSVLFAAGQSDENSKALLQIQEKSRGDPDRMSDLLAHPENAPQKQRLALENLARGAKNAPILSLSGAEQSFASGDEEDKLARLDTQAKSFHEQTEEEHGIEDTRISEVRRLRRELYRRQHPTLDLIPGIEGAQSHFSFPEERQSSGTLFPTPEQSLPILQKMLAEIQRGNQQDMTRDRTGLKNDLPGQQ